jgi:hypothetical protein
MLTVMGKVKSYVFRCDHTEQRGAVQCMAWKQYPGNAVEGEIALDIDGWLVTSWVPKRYYCPAHRHLYERPDRPGPRRRNRTGG